MLVLVLVVAAVIGLIAASTAWRSPGLSVMSDSAIASVLILGAGLSLVGVGMEHIRRKRRGRLGVLLACGGFAWLLSEWAYPAIGSSIGFTVGLALGWLAPAVVAHALITFGEDRLRAHEVVLVACGYGVFGVLLGLVPTLTFDAAAARCSFCPTVLIAVAPSSVLSAASTAVGTVGGAVVALLVAGAMAGKLVRQTRAAWLTRAPVQIPGATFMLSVAVELGRGFGQETIPTGGMGHLLRAAEAALLIGVAAGVTAEWLRARRSRARVARVVADLVHSPPLGGLREVLSSTLRDPALRLAYPLPDGRQVDVSGRSMRLDEPRQPSREVTSIVRSGEVVALLDHRSDVLHSAETVAEVIRAARLGLEHERLQAETRAQLADLSAARKRIVAAAGLERQRLERDLHDGAQQHLIAIAIGIRALGADPSGISPRSVDHIAEAANEIAMAIEQLREVAHGIYPSVLADEGLAAAIESLAEGSQTPVTVGDVEVDPVDLPVAEAAYAIVSEVVGLAAGPISVRAARDGESLTVVVQAPKVSGELLVEFGDRIGAVDGVLRVLDTLPGRSELLVEIPCVS
jgi:signal transduction histidine kinase